MIKQHLLSYEAVEKLLESIKAYQEAKKRGETGPEFPEWVPDSLAVLLWETWAFLRKVRGLPVYRLPE